MRQSEWMPIYEAILADMGYDRSEDEACARVLRAVTMSSDLVTEDEAAHRFGREATVFGDARCLESDLGSMGVHGTSIASGSCVGRLLEAGVLPDAVVTDLDGDIDAQLEASSRGSLTFVHAHGDNMDLVREYAGRFTGPLILTTQSKPDTVVVNFGGFTDGDRAVCIAQEFGAREVWLEGFDFLHPNPKAGSDPAVKLRKLAWAERIIRSLEPDILLHLPTNHSSAFIG